jgi:hypothetical protein
VKFAPVLLVLVGCASGLRSAELRQGLNDPVLTELDSSPPQPLPKPFRLAVAPPRGGAWTPDERAAIRAWGEEFKTAGIISDLEFIPEMLLTQSRTTDEQLRRIREAAVRLRADAVLVCSSASATDAYANPLSILNLTIVGMWVAPAHHRDAMVVVEAVLMDSRSGGLHLSASGGGPPSACVRWSMPTPATRSRRRASKPSRRWERTSRARQAC